MPVVSSEGVQAARSALLQHAQRVAATLGINAEQRRGKGGVKTFSFVAVWRGLCDRLLTEPPSAARVSLRGDLRELARLEARLLFAARPEFVAGLGLDIPDLVDDVLATHFAPHLLADPPLEVWQRDVLDKIRRHNPRQIFMLALLVGAQRSAEIEAQRAARDGLDDLLSFLHESVRPVARAAARHGGLTEGEGEEVLGDVLQSELPEVLIAAHPRAMLITIVKRRLLNLKRERKRVGRPDGTAVANTAPPDSDNARRLADLTVLGFASRNPTHAYVAQAIRFGAVPAELDILYGWSPNTSSRYYSRCFVTDHDRNLRLGTAIDAVCCKKSNAAAALGALDPDDRARVHATVEAVRESRGAHEVLQLCSADFVRAQHREQRALVRVAWALRHGFAPTDATARYAVDASWLERVTPALQKALERMPTLSKFSGYMLHGLFDALGIPPEVLAPHAKVTEGELREGGTRYRSTFWYDDVLSERLVVRALHARSVGLHVDDGARELRATLARDDNAAALAARAEIEGRWTDSAREPWSLWNTLVARYVDRVRRGEVLEDSWPVTSAKKDEVPQ